MIPIIWRLAKLILFGWTSNLDWFNTRREKCSVIIAVAKMFELDCRSLSQDKKHRHWPEILLVSTRKLFRNFFNSNIATNNVQILTYKPHYQCLRVKMALRWSTDSSLKIALHFAPIANAKLSTWGPMNKAVCNQSVS